MKTRQIKVHVVKEVIRELQDSKIMTVLTCPQKSKGFNASEIYRAHTICKNSPAETLCYHVTWVGSTQPNFTIPI